MSTSSCGRTHDVYDASCPCRHMLDLLANKWSALALGALEDGPRRFGALRVKLDGVSPKVLTATLRRLEEHGLIDRTVYPAVPLHVEYSLTPLGREACEPLAHLRRWVVDNIERFPQPAVRAESPDPRAIPQPAVRAESPDPRALPAAPVLAELSDPRASVVP